MTQSEQRDTQTLGQRVRGLAALFTITVVALVFFVVMSWRATSTRVTALEARFDKLTETLDQRLPDRNWRVELERVVKGLEARTEERLLRDKRRLTADLEARMQALMAVRASVNPPQGRSGTVKSRDVAHDSPRSPGRSGASSGAGADVEVRVEAAWFEAVLQSIYGSLELTPERRDELGTGLEEILDAFWPEYVALSKSSDPDPGELGQRLCSAVESILTSEEAARIGCGPSASMIPEQPGTTSEPPPEGQDEAHRPLELPPEG